MPAKPSLGLYFNDNFVEVSQISNDGKRLERFNQMILPPGLVVNSEIKNSVGFSQVLIQLFLTAKPSQIKINQEVVVGVNDNRVFLREFNLPNVAGKNLNDAIEYQVRSLLPVMPTGVETDWQIIGKDADGLIEVLLAAIPRSIIESYVSVCASIGLRVVAVEPAVFANIRIINPVQLQGKNQLLVYLGDNYGVFSYITSGNPRFSDFLSQGEIDKNGEMAKTVLAYINFANSKHPNRPVQEIVVSGSRQDIDSMVSELKTENVFAFKAVSRLHKTAVANHSLLHTAHGLSLKTFDDQPSLNVLPVDFRMEVVKQRSLYSWKLVLSLLIIFSLVGLSALFYLYKNVLDRQTQLMAIKNDYDQQLKLPENLNLIKQANDLNKITGQLLTLRGAVGGEESILRELSAITSNGITLTSLVVSRSPGSKKLADSNSSWIITGTASSRALVLSFYENLLNNPDFSGGKLYFGSLEKDIGLTFRIASQPTK